MARRNPILALVVSVLVAGVLVTGFVSLSAVLIVLALAAPVVLLAFVGFLALSLLALPATIWLLLASGAPTRANREAEVDPTTELQRRYVRGEIGEEEFERRLSVLLDAGGTEGREREGDGRIRQRSLRR